MLPNWHHLPGWPTAGTGRSADLLGRTTETGVLHRRRASINMLTAHRARPAPHLPLSQAMMPSAFGKWILVGLLAAAAVGSAEQPDDSPPSYLFFAKESKVSFTHSSVPCLVALSDTVCSLSWPAGLQTQPGGRLTVHTR